MKINIHETISNVYTEDRTLIKSNTLEMLYIYPDEGKLLKNILTGYTTDKSIGIGSNDKLENYIEINK